jgi:hypothetical protein
MKKDWREGDGPKQGWLLWKSDEHLPSTDGATCHWFAIAPEDFWKDHAK